MEYSIDGDNTTNLNFEVRDIFCNINVNSDNTKTLINDFNSAIKYIKENKLSCKLSESKRKVIYEPDLENRIVSLHFSKTQGSSSNIREVFNMPPKGPILLFTECPYCNNIGPQYHEVECKGPYDHLILTEDGINHWADNIRQKIESGEIEIDEDTGLFYKDLFPPTGILKMESEKNYTPGFDNMIEMKFRTQPFLSGKRYRNMHTNGINVTVRLGKKGELTITSCPYFTDNEDTDETYYETLLTKILNDKNDILKNSSKKSKSDPIQEDKYFISSLNGIFDLNTNEWFKKNSTEKGKVLNLETYKTQMFLGQLYMYFNLLKEGDFWIKNPTYDSVYKSLRCSFNAFDMYKISIDIKESGIVRIFISYIKTNPNYQNFRKDPGMFEEFEMNDYREITNKLSNNETIKYQKINHKLFIIVCQVLLFDIHTLFRSTHYREDIFKDNVTVVSYLNANKIQNTALDYTLTDSGEIKYNIGKNIKSPFPPQPQKCRNSIPKKLFQRPVPFSFGGNAPTRNSVIRSEGVESNAKVLIGNRKVLIEPCCEKVKGKNPTGRYKDMKFSSGDVITQERLEEMEESLNETVGTISKEQLLQYLLESIGQTTSVKHKMLRRIIYGFPNNKFQEDFASNNFIAEGYEYIPDVDKNTKIDFNRSYPTKRVFQDDIACSVYIPGTQLTNYGGNNTFIRDSRKFVGLISLMDSKYNENEVKEYLKNCIKNFLITHQSSDINTFPMPLTSSRFNDMVTEGFKYLTLDDKCDIPVIRIATNINLIEEIELQDGTVISRQQFKDYTNTNELKKELSLSSIVYFIDIHENLYRWFLGINHYYMGKLTIDLKVGIDNDHPNMIRLFYPNTNTSIRSDILNLQGDTNDYLIVLLSDRKKMSNNKVYRFGFNYYTQPPSSSYGCLNYSRQLIEEQPLIPIHPIKNLKRSYDTQEDVDRKIEIIKDLDELI